MSLTISLRWDTVGRSMSSRTSPDSWCMRVSWSSSRSSKRYSVLVTRGAPIMSEVPKDSSYCLSVKMSLATIIAPPPCFPYCQPMARHFNIMIDGFSTIENRGMDAASLLRRMVRQGISPDAYTLTSFIKNSSTVTELKHIWVQAQERYGVKPTFINYVAYITSLGRLLDPSQACIVFDEMEEKKIYRSVVAWNALLGTISQPENSLQTLETGSDGVLASEVNGLSGSDASKKILQMMKGNLMYPNPNSQTFCLVATALAK